MRKHHVCKNGQKVGPFNVCAVLQMCGFYLACELWKAFLENYTSFL